MLKTEAERTHKYPAWSGTYAQLERLATIVGDAVREQLEETIQSELLEFEPQKASLQKDLEDARNASNEGMKAYYQNDLDALEVTIQRQIAKVTEVFAPLAIIKQGREGVEHEGSLQAIRESDDTDLERVSSIQIVVRNRIFGTPTCSIGMDPEGVKLFVRGRPSWVRKTVAELDPAIKRDVPWWGFLRTTAAALLFGVVVAAAVSFTFLLITGGEWDGEDGKPIAPGYVAGTIGAVACGAGAILGMFYHSFARWLFPGVEVLEPGSQSKGRRAVGLIGTLALAIGTMVGGGILYD